jgi:hypothetical protein
VNALPGNWATQVAPELLVSPLWKTVLNLKQPGNGCATSSLRSSPVPCVVEAAGIHVRGPGSVLGHRFAPSIGGRP